MSLIAPLANASAASSTINLFTHGHKKGGTFGSAKDAAASSSPQGAATTQSLLGSVFESLEQVIGISVTAPHAASSSATALANLSQSAQSVQSGGNQTPGTIGANVNLRV